MENSMSKTNMREGHKFYLKQFHPEFSVSKGLGRPVDCKTYLSIVGGFMQFIMRKVFEGFDVTLTAKLGIIGIRGKKVEPIITETGEIRGIAPNWGKTKEAWLAKAKELGMTFEEYVEKVPQSERNLVYCFNEGSNMIKYRICWYNDNVTIKNRTLYGLTFSRTNRRVLSSLIIKENREYLVIEK